MPKPACITSAAPEPCQWSWICRWMWGSRLLTNRCTAQMLILPYHHRCPNLSGLRCSQHASTGPTSFRTGMSYCNTHASLTPMSLPAAAQESCPPLVVRHRFFPPSRIKLSSKLSLGILFSQILCAARTRPASGDLRRQFGAGLAPNPAGLRPTALPCGHRRGLHSGCPRS